MTCQTIFRSILGALVVSAGLAIGTAWLSRALAEPKSVKQNPVLPSVVGQPLTADQLAGMLNLNAWSLTYSGGRIQCWLEIEEVGGKTPMKRRVPEKGFVGEIGDIAPEVLKNRQGEGTILFWWSKNADGNGGSLNLNVSNAGSYGLGLGNDAFTFGWKSFGASSASIGKQPPVTAKPGEEIVLVSYDASESQLPGSKQSPREVHLRLKARFPEQSP